MSILIQCTMTNLDLQKKDSSGKYFHLFPLEVSTVCVLREASKGNILKCGKTNSTRLSNVATCSDHHDYSQYITRVKMLSRLSCLWA